MSIDDTSEPFATPAKERGWRPSPKLLLAVLVLALAVVLAFQNTASTDIEVLWWSVTAPLWLALVTMLVAGVLVGTLVAWRRHRA